jgi:D-alanyl-D-alanine carboxypeptidase
VAVSNVEEVTRIYDCLFTGILIDRDRLDRMLRPVRVPGSHPPAVSPSAGLGILSDPDGEFGPSYGHGGGGPGYTLSTSILPEFSAGRLALAAFCNSSVGKNAGEAERELMAIATGALRA